ncbi:MAG TPA: hypothetical protein VNK05_00480, partial [Chloroflexota bacterium]|nr:hypothetical protein [Chloroflexota bacterium]
MSRAARVGEQRAVVWKRVYFRPAAARRSAVGVWIGPPKALGVVPQACALTARAPGLPAWEAVPAARKPILARQMEVYAAFLEYADT